MSASNFQDLNILKFNEDIRLAAQITTNISDSYNRKVPCFGAQEARVVTLTEPVTARLQSPGVVSTVDTPSTFLSRWCPYNPLIIEGHIPPLTRYQTNIDPLPITVKNYIAALRRAEEDLLIDALGGFAKQGSGIGNNSTTLIPLPTSNIIPVDFGTPGNNTGMTLAKFKQAIKLLKQNKVLNGNMMEVRPVALFNAETFDQFTNITQVTSRDFNEPVLRTGMVSSYMNVDIIQSENVPVDASGIIDVYMWMPEYLVKGVWEDVSSVAMPDPGKEANALKMTVKLACGYVREEDAAFIKIRCQGPV